MSGRPQDPARGYPTLIRRAEGGKDPSRAASSTEPLALDLEHAILTAEGIGNSAAGLGVIFPLPVHAKAVLILARGKFQHRRPHAVAQVFQGDSRFRPAGEVSRQEDGRASS